MKNLENYYYFKIRKVCLTIILLGAFNCGLKIFNIDLIKAIGNNIKNKIGYNATNFLNILITISVIYIFIIDKNIWTPFFGETVIPCALINKEPPTDYNFTKTIKTTPNTKIMYWASLENKNGKDVWDAYGNYSNSGVVYSDKKGNATLKLKTPSYYIVPSGNKINKHIHYRECPEIDDPTSMTSELKTVYL